MEGEWTSKRDVEREREKEKRWGRRKERKVGCYVCGREEKVGETGERCDEGKRRKV